MQHFIDEWKVIQNQQDRFELASLLIKLCNVFLLLLLIFLDFPFAIGALFLGVLWLQDAVTKTFQSRGEKRLLRLEKAIANGCDLMLTPDDTGHKNQYITEKPFQFNQTFIDSRPTTIGLISVYLKQSLRPTVALPHVVLVLMFLVHGI